MEKTPKHTRFYVKHSGSSVTHAYNKMQQKTSIAELILNLNISMISLNKSQKSVLTSVKSFLFHHRPKMTQTVSMSKYFQVQLSVAFHL